MGTQAQARRALFLLLPRHFHHLPPTPGFGNQHGAEFTGVPGDGDGAEFAEPLSDRGIGKGCERCIKAIGGCHNITLQLYNHMIIYNAYTPVKPPNRAV